MKMTVKDRFVDSVTKGKAEAVGRLVDQVSELGLYHADQPVWDAVCIAEQVLEFALAVCHKDKHDGRNPYRGKLGRVRSVVDRELGA